MVDIWNSIKNTAESVGGAFKAPAGVVWDIAAMPFDDKDDDFGTFVHAITTRAGDVLDPLVNPQTISGNALNKSLAAMNWAWREGVSEPLATGNTMVHHVTGVPTYALLAGPLGLGAGAAFGDHHYGDILDAKAWSQAYDQAQQQENAAGATLAWGTLNPLTDPLSVENPYQQVQKEHGALASGIAWTGEIEAMFAADPTALALKGAGAARRLSQFAKLSQAEKATLYTRITEGSKAGVLRPNLAARTDRYLNWIDGTKNAQGRPLTAPEILHGTPELKKYAAEPHVIASLLSDANKIENAAERRDVQRRILAVAAGDESQVGRLRSEVTEAGAIADQLANMVKEGSLDLKRLAEAPLLRTDPMFVQKLDSQWANLNGRGDIDRFLDDWNGRLTQILDTTGSLPNLPGVHTAGKRAVNRLNETGKLRAVDNAANAVDDWAAKRALEAKGASTVYQQGLHSLPVVAVKTAGFLASPYTKAPVAISDALRQTKFTGLANLHDWGGTTTQLDSMMKLGQVAPEERLGLLDEIYRARTEPEKMRLINKAEELSLLSLAQRYSTRYGRGEVDSDYIKTLLTEHAGKRNSSLAMLQSRAYSATEQTPDMLARRGSAMRAEAEGDLANAKALTGKEGLNAAIWGAPKGTSSWRPRVDMIDDDGTMLSLPVLESQAANTIPLMDMDIAAKLLKRDNGRLARLSRAWKEDQLELKRLTELKAKGATGIDKAIAAKAASVDFLVSAGQTFMRGWKQSVLFRLGYPMRVLMDDHFRIWSQMNAMSFYGGNIKELAGNAKFNQLDRRIQGKRALHALKVRRQEILDELDASEMTAHLDRQSDLRSIQSSLKGKERYVASLRKQLEDAETKHSLGLGGAVNMDRNLPLQGFEAKSDAFYRMIGEAGYEDFVANKVLRARQGSKQGYTAPYFGEFPLQRYAAKKGEFDYIAEVPAARIAKAENGYYVPTGGADSVPGEFVKVYRRNRETGETTLVFQGTQANITGRPRVLPQGGSTKVSQLREQLKAAESEVEDLAAAQAHYMDQLGDYGPDALKRELESVEDLIRLGSKGLADPKRRIGSADVTLPDGTVIPGAFSDESGNITRILASSQDSFENQLRGVEDRMYRTMAGGSHRTIQPSERGHLHAWAEVLNNQLRTSKVAMHFLEGKSVDDFVRWIKEGEQADLRRRVAHFAHDPEDWGHRVQAMVWDYVPTADLRDALLAGRVKAARLGKMFPDASMRPAVHGRALADNIGSSYAVQAAGRLTDRIYRLLGEVPTDRLSRHPYFNSLYKQHANEIYGVKKTSLGADYRFTQEDLDDIAARARRMALRDLKATLFDISAHSHAAHMMRFISPFFAAHQESVARWWRIAADNPVVIRRYIQAFDVPKHLGIVVDANGDLVKPGDPVSKDHRILLQLPMAFGGPNPEDHMENGKLVPGVQSNWRVSESAFNIVLQGGLTNPGLGPVAAIPLDYAAMKFADDESLQRVARVFNPFPPTSPLDNLLPAWYKRLSGAVYGETGIDPSLIGVGKREHTAAFGQIAQDLMVDFQLKNGREPNANEVAKILKDAGTLATSQMFHRLLWNIGSPAPASPTSKHATVQQGWYKISEQARAEGKDFDWAAAQFRERYGEAYLPLIYSTSNNPAWVDANPATVGALKHYKGLLNKVDPALTRVVIGAYADEMIEKNATLGEYSADARNYLREEQMRPGSSETYYSYDEPAQALEEQMARRGWQQYGELTAALTAYAQQMGLRSYEESDELMAYKRAGVEVIKEANYAFAKDYDTVDSGQFDRYLTDLRDIAGDPKLVNDTERTDIQTLKNYLMVRDYFVQAFEARKAAGYGSYEAQANADLRSAYTQYVYALVESNLDFEEYIWNGLVERDPLLAKSSLPVTAQ